jgi:hypothetical protein
MVRGRQSIVISKSLELPSDAEPLPEGSTIIKLTDPPFKVKQALAKHGLK